MNYPQYLLLIPVLAVAAWYFRGLQLWRPLRAAAALLLVFALTDPAIDRPQRGLDLWVLIDRSTSAAERIDRDLAEWKQLLERSRRSRADRIRYVEYAGEVVAAANSETVNFPGDRNLTRTALAVENALALANPEKRARVLVFTDGFSTEPLTGIAAKLNRAEIPLDYRLVTAPGEVDYRVEELALPQKVQVGEPFVVEIGVRGNLDGSVPVTVFRDGNAVARREVDIVNGRGRVRLADRLVEAGSHRFQARIAPENDAFSGNNAFESWIEVAAGPRLLLITAYPDDPIASILRAQDFDVLTVTEPRELTIGQLTGCRAVILNNVPAYEIPVEFLDALDFFVSDQGGGLMMAGGKFSFGSGGYYESPVDPLLPVSMELKSEHRKLVVAMAIVMDRSGSMGMTVPGGQTKMDLANEGASNAVNLLGEQDFITVFAVDSQPHEVVPLLPVGPNRGSIQERVRRVESMGGGIFVYDGLVAAWDQLKNASVGQRHLILFTDAADSEQPGAYRNLVQEMTENGTTVSVIGLGTRSDSDAAFIEDIAKRGNGRIFFSQNPSNLPNIFAQETVAVARSTFIDEPTAAEATGGWYEIARRDFEWLGEIDGYNLSYTRPDDTAALISGDEYAAPLVAYGRRGIGRSAAVSFPLGGEFSERVRNWDRVGDFIQTLGRWIMGEDVPPGIGLRTDLTGTELTVDLLYDESEWSERLASRPPRLLLAEDGGSEEVREMTWERIAPGRFSARTDLTEGLPVRGAVQIGGQALTFGPLVVGSSTEWAFEQDRVEELRAVSAASGGRELLDLGDAWDLPPVKRATSLVPLLATLLLLVVLLDALITRTGWQLPSLAPLTGRLREARARPATKSLRSDATAAGSPTSASPGPPPEASTPSPSAEAAGAAATAAEEEAKVPQKRARSQVSNEKSEEDQEAEAASRRSRFARAKKHRK